MPWRTTNLMSLRQEFVTMALQAGVSMSELCRRFEISRKTGYKWLRRYHAEDLRGLADRSRRPHRIRIHVPPVVEETILTLRARHPSWGARKIRRRLHAHGLAPLPACSTITAVLHRHGLIFPEHAGGRSQGVMPMEQFPTPPQIGEELEVHIEGFDSANGLLLLSRKGAAIHANWDSVAVGQTDADGIVHAEVPVGVEFAIDVTAPGFLGSGASATVSSHERWTFYLERSSD